MELRDYQQRGVDLALAAIRSRDPRRRLLAAPTGSGKSLIERDILAACAADGIDAILVTPSPDIRRGLAAKGCDESRIWTPVSLRNRLLDGVVSPPRVIVWDEAHHTEAESWRQISLSCDAVEIGLTATPYRGTPRSTAAFREYWGRETWLIGYADAIDRGVISLPSCRTVPLLDDDIIRVTASGEFDVETVTRETGSRVADFAALIDACPLDRPTMVALPSRELCRLVAERCRTRCVIVDGETSEREREAAFADCVACRAVLIQIRVVGEGVDLPIRRLIDATPMMSPVQWVQLFGRAMRPLAAGDLPSEYIATNRNLIRHAYAVQGVVPVAELRESITAFGGTGSRTVARAIGLEGIGRFKSNPLPLANGLVGDCFMIEAGDAKIGVRQYAALVHPGNADPLWATRVNVAGKYGRWTRCDPPVRFEGFASGKGSAVSDKQREWWVRDAGKYGLDPAAEVNRRTFAALPVLASLNVRID